MASKKKLSKMLILVVIVLVLGLLAAILIADNINHKKSIVSDVSSTSWKFAAIGDNRPGTSYDYSQNVYGILSKIPNDQRITILNSGDLTHDGTKDEWDNFKSITAPLGIDWSKKDPPQYIAGIGNHDANDADWQTNWMANMPALINTSAYADISGDSSGLYGSIKYNNALFIWLDYLSLTSSQETFLADTLSRAKDDTSITWRFVVFHSPPVSCGTAVHTDWDPGKIWHDKYFQPYGVDILFLGDNHYYERSCPFLNNLSQSTDSSDKTEYCDSSNRGNNISDTDGVIHIIVGNGGAETEKYSPTYQCGWLESPYEKAPNHGFLIVEINGSTLHGIEYDTDTEVGTEAHPASTNFFITDEFTITKKS